MSLIQPTRRGFLAGLVGFVAAAPAIVRATSIMPVKPIPRMVILDNGAVTGMWHKAIGEDTFMYSEELSAALRESLMPFAQFRQFVDASDLFS